MKRREEGDVEAGREEEGRKADSSESSEVGELGRRRIATYRRTMSALLQSKKPSNPMSGKADYLLFLPNGCRHGSS